MLLIRIIPAVICTGLLGVGHATNSRAQEKPLPQALPQAPAQRPKLEIVPNSSNTSDIEAAVISPNGQYFISTSGDALKLWDITSGRLIRVFEGHKDRTWSVIFSPTGLSALSGGGDRLIKLWDLASGRLLRIFEGPLVSQC